MDETQKTADAEQERAVQNPAFGTCCAELSEALAGEDFLPLMTVGADGVLYVSVGEVEIDQEESGFVDHPMFFCPFCGTGLQTPEDVKSKIGDEGENEAS
jgi:hypothetical protein